VKEIGRATRKRCSAEEKLRIVLDGLRGGHGIAKEPLSRFVEGTPRHREAASGERHCVRGDR
jgi:transposase-like protein